MIKEKLNRVRVAMIGAGRMANRVHYPSLASFADVEIAAICDLDTTRLNATADKYGVSKRYTSYPKMVDEVAPDAVYVIGQPEIMYDIWIWCLKHKLNLYIEKPMGITIHQARALAYLAEENDCITQVSFQRRCTPLAVKLREEILKQSPVIHAVSSYIKYVPGPDLRAMAQMMANGVHVIDTLRWMCGGEVVEVQSATRRVRAPDINLMSATLRFDNGAIGMMVASFSTGRHAFRLEMHGYGISAECIIEGAGTFQGQGREERGTLYPHDSPQGVPYDARDVAGSDDFAVFCGYRAKSREFIDALKSGTQPASCFADGLKTMEVAETILAQAHLQGD